MIVAGLTGSIAMGKSTVAGMFEARGWPVFDADAAVRAFYASEGAAKIEREFPGVVVDGVVDRVRLSQRALGDAAAMRRLEQIVHPEVARMRRAFLAEAEKERRRGVIVDIPLLFETAAERSVDVVIVVSAGEAAQRARALARPGMSEAKFAQIVARQTPDGEKRRRAHFVIDASGALAFSRRQVEDVVRALAAAPGRDEGRFRDA